MKKQNKILKNEVALLKAMLESTRDAIALWQNGDEPILSNEKFEEMWWPAGGRSTPILTLDQIGQQLLKGDRWLADMQKLVRLESVDERVVNCRDGRYINQYSLPMKTGGELQGRVFSFSDVTQQILLERELRYLSTTDALTGLRNRRELLTILGREAGRACRYRHDLGVLEIDIDHFKKINDNWGHERGDETLIHVAKIINNHIRSNDYSFRTGGEEFLVIAPETSRESILMMAERLRQSIEKHGKESGVYCTISLGLATLSQLPSGCSEERLLALADAQLYQAKKRGRNRISIANPMPDKYRE